MQPRILPLLPSELSHSRHCNTPVGARRNYSRVRAQGGVRGDIIGTKTRGDSRGRDPVTSAVSTMIELPMNVIRTCLLFLCLLVTGPSMAWAAPIFLEDHTQGLTLSGPGHTLWLQDDTGALTLDDVRSADLDRRFEPAPPALLRSRGAQAHWFKLQMEQRTHSGDWVLATQTTALKDVQFFGPFDSTGRALAPPVHTGLSQVFSTRPLSSERYLMRLQLPAPGVYTVYARLVSEAAPILGLSVWDTAEYLQWRQHKRLFDGICYGILLALLVYNLVLTAIFRDAAYGYYVGQCAFALLTLASFNGHAAHYLWGDWPWWQERSNVVLPGLWMLFAMLFARSFLEARLVPWLNRAFLGAGAVASLAVALAIAGQLGLAQALNEGTATGGALLATVGAIVIMRRGYVPARWYLGGQAALFVSALGVVLVNWKVVDAPFLLANGLQIGVSVEMVVFALALSTRIGRMRSTQTRLRLQAEHLATAAATDPLTGLANRTGLAQGAARVLADGTAITVMLLDLDRFKPINDAHGHDAGDVVLRAVAERLQSQIRPHDLVARLGGDEFILLLAGHLPDAQLAAMAERLGAAIQEPIHFQGKALTVGSSTGIARSPQDGRTLTELVRSADLAMYQAKQSHSGYAFHRTA